MNGALESPVPDSILELIDEDIRDTLPEGITFAELIAVRAVHLASRGQAQTALAAMGLIKGVQGDGPDPVDPGENGAPILPSTEEQRLDLVEQLGARKR